MPVSRPGSFPTRCLPWLSCLVWKHCDETVRSTTVIGYLGLSSADCFRPDRLRSRSVEDPKRDPKEAVCFKRLSRVYTCVFGPGHHVEALSGATRRNRCRQDHGP